MSRDFLFPGSDSWTTKECSSSKFLPLAARAAVASLWIVMSKSKNGLEDTGEANSTYANRLFVLKVRLGSRMSTTVPNYPRQEGEQKRPYFRKQSAKESFVIFCWVIGDPQHCLRILVDWDLFPFKSFHVFSKSRCSVELQSGCWSAMGWLLPSQTQWWMISFLVVRKVSQLVAEWLHTIY